MKIGTSEGYVEEVLAAAHSSVLILIQERLYNLSSLLLTLFDPRFLFLICSLCSWLMPAELFYVEFDNHNCFPSNPFLEFQSCTWEKQFYIGAASGMMNLTRDLYILCCKGFPSLCMLLGLPRAYVWHREMGIMCALICR